MALRATSTAHRVGACLAALALAGLTAPAPAAEALRVCADPASLPQSNAQGEGYENKIAAALAHDLDRRLEYTYFPQRMGFVRNTLRARDETTHQFKCDLIIGVPHGYDLTATTQPYLHSTYALVFAPHAALKGVHSVADVLSLPGAARAQLRLGVFARTPAADWLLKNDLMQQRSSTHRRAATRTRRPRTSSSAISPPATSMPQYYGGRSPGTSRAGTPARAHRAGSCCHLLPIRTSALTTRSPWACAPANSRGWTH